MNLFFVLLIDNYYKLIYLLQINILATTNLQLTHLQSWETLPPLYAASSVSHF